MKSVHCAAVDLGATSGRVIVGSWNGRRLALTEVRRFANQFRSLAGNDYWDLPYLWQEVRAGLTSALGRFPGLASVGVDGWGVDHVLLDARGRLVFPPCAYRDGRTAPFAARLGRRGINEIYALTGIPNLAFNTSLQLQETLASCPNIPEVAARCLFVPDYFNFLLSGRMANELSISSTSQLLSVGGRSWCTEALAHFGIPERWFSKPLASPRRLGPVTGIAGMRGVLSVLVPGHDTACAYAAMPAAADGSDFYLSSGTWSLLGFESDVPVLGKDALAANVTNERLGDGRYSPMKVCIGLWLLEQILPEMRSRPRTAPEWRDLIRDASLVPPSRALLDVADSSLFNPPSMRGAIDAMLGRLGARPPRSLAAYVRLICDSLGKGHADALRGFERLTGRSFRRILMVGGGSKNRLLCQATADAAGVPVASFSLEGAVVGNVASQLVALGAVDDLSAFRRLHSEGLSPRVFRPRGRAT
jgi:rhamnulokinase